MGGYTLYVSWLNGLISKENGIQSEYKVEDKKGWISYATLQHLRVGGDHIKN